MLNINKKNLSYIINYITILYNYNINFEKIYEKNFKLKNRKDNNILYNKNIKIIM